MQSSLDFIEFFNEIILKLFSVYDWISNYNWLYDPVLNDNESISKLQLFGPETSIQWHLVNPCSKSEFKRNMAAAPAELKTLVNI